MNKEFFTLPAPVKRAIWAALVARWAAKKARQPLQRLTGLQDGI